MLEKFGNAISHYHILFKYKVLYGSKLNIGNHVRFRGNSRISISDEAEIKIGNNVFINDGCSINSRDSVVIGSDTIIGEGVKIYDHNHRFSRKMQKTRQGFSVAPVVIGSNCWIGSNVVILKGVHVGNNTVIGAGVVLDRSVGDNLVVTCGRELKMKQIVYKRREAEQ